jgi:outer membrane protein OmpA-like peptidoglycan-associated protein
MISSPLHIHQAAHGLLSIVAALTLRRPPQIPLCPGLTIVTAVNDKDGDYESIKTIQSIDDHEVVLRYSSERKENGVVNKVKVQRRILLDDLQRSNLYLIHFHNRAAMTIPGTTAIGTSTAVLRALEQKGSAQLGLFDGTYSASPVDPAIHPNIYDYEEVEPITRVGTGVVSLPMLVNDAPAALPAIEATGDYAGDKADFLFLDDESNPIALRYRIGRDALDVVKIAYACDPRGTVVSRLERALLETGRADVYSIYFSFNSDEIREESDSTLREIGGIMHRHPDWKLAINGHTDNIGGDEYNLDLSRRRAAAVREALVRRDGIAGGRLTTAGYGKRNPKGTNDTLEGRARNRRVELVRTP